MENEKWYVKAWHKVIAVADWAAVLWVGTVGTFPRATLIIPAFALYKLVRLFV